LHSARVKQRSPWQLIGGIGWPILAVCTEEKSLDFFTDNDGSACALLP